MPNLMPSSFLITKLTKQIGTGITRFYITVLFPKMTLGE